MATHPLWHSRSVAWVGAFVFLLASAPSSLAKESPPDTGFVDSADAGAGPSAGRRDSSSSDPLVQESRSDSRLARTLRERLEQESDLSPDAKSVKITSNHGSILLKGKVASEVEKVKVGELAKEVSRTGLVENHLKVETQAQ